MGISIRLLCLAALMAVASEPRSGSALLEGRLRSGDVVLQTSLSSRSALIRKASASRYSHVGLVEVAADGVFVIEAVEPVSRTPFSQWRRRGAKGRVTVLRARNVEHAALERVVAEAKRELGKPYDSFYRWDDERLYCSELVVKAFERGARLKVGEQQQVKTLQLTPEMVALGSKLHIDLEQSLVTPESVARDSQFEVLHSDFE